VIGDLLEFAGCFRGAGLLYMGFVET
jgi:hypothetical protein